MSAPTEALGLVPNYDRGPGERFDIRPHGTEAHAQRHRRRGEKPCPACLAAETAANAYRTALREGRARCSSPRGTQTAVTTEYVTEIWCPPADNGVHALHSRMPEPEPLPEPEPEAEL